MGHNMNFPFSLCHRSHSPNLDDTKKFFGLLGPSTLAMVVKLKFLAMTTRQRYQLHRFLVDKEIPMSPTNGTKSSSYTIGDSNFDSNMVIILAALLCALICALGLNSIVRCALRCGQRFSSETAVARLASTGLKKEALGQIPVAVYKSGDIPATECPICLGEFVEGEKVRILPKCNHGFHVKCIDKWLVSHSSCPTCRQLLFTEEV